ncbi:MAG: hypothetical protein J6B77_00055 [Clostridia bacterium]|nr:hypothetical protein [Clostridia bacterium]
MCRSSVSAAICIREAEDRESLDLLLSEARVAHRSIVVLFSGAQAQCGVSSRELELLARYGAQWYFATEGMLDKAPFEKHGEHMEY